MSKKIYLSPSNQDGNMYAVNGTVSEMEQCNRFADAAKKALERCGFEVKKAPEGQKMSVSIAESIRGAPTCISPSTPTPAPTTAPVPQEALLCLCTAQPTTLT